MNTCAGDIINEFLTTLQPKTLDESCLAEIPNESFMTNLNGGTLIVETNNAGSAEQGGQD